MKARTALVALLAITFSFAACESVRTENDSTESASDPAVYVGVPLEEAQVSAPGTEATPSTSTPTPKPVPQRESYTSVEISQPIIAMTFDDGPHPVHTPKLLDMLKERNIKATFYVVGQLVNEYPDIVRRMAAEGHEVANHTWSHPYLTKLGADSVKSQIQKSSDAIEKLTGRRPTNMRPPYGATNSRLNKRMNEEFGLKVIMWSVDPMDWRYRNAARVTNEILTKTQPGGIVLAHDIHASTVAAMPATLDGLAKKGFQFVTVSELIALEGAGAEPTPTASADHQISDASPNPASTPFVVRRLDESGEPL